MLRLDELETLSRLAAGELPAGKAEQVKGELQRRPELAAAFEQLLSLDQALKELPPTLSSSELEALVARVPRPRRPFVRPPVAVTSGVAAAVLIAAIGTFLVTRNGQPQPRLVALMGTVTLDGRALAPPSQALPLQPGAVVRCGVESASIIENGQARMLLARDSELVVSGDATPDFALQSGTLAATGPEIRLSAGDAHFELTGRGVLSWEPEADLLRVTDGMDTKQPRRLGFKWLRLPIAATAVAAGGVTLLVLEGRAKVTTDSNARIEVTAGQKWSSSDARATPIPSGAALTASADTLKSNPKQNPAPSVSPPGSTSPEALTRDQLVAEVKKLRSENTALARRNDEIQKRLEDSDPKAQARKENYYRADPDELRALAERGEMRLHPPALGHTLDLDNPGVANDVGLRPDEVAKIRDIYERAERRLHDGLASLYVGMGADANVANSLETTALIQEIQSKTLLRDRNLAVLTTTRERGGLERPTSPDAGSALLRAYRLFYREEDRVLEELDALLGPDRAEQFMNHPNTSHSTMSSSTTPPDRRSR